MTVRMQFARWWGAVRPTTGGPDRGSVILEAAMGFPIVICVGLAMVWGIGVGVTSMRMADTARDAARAIARGESVDEVLIAARRQSPEAQVEVSRDTTSVQVRVRRTVHMPVLSALDLDLDEHAVAAVEQPW